MFLKRIIPFFLVTITAVFLFGSCSEYQKVLKSTDVEYKYKKTKEYYDEGKYYKSYPLLEELVTVYRGTQRAEELYYMWAYADYYLDDLLLASYRFTQFTKTFPTSDHREECEFMSAYCQYLMSPPWRLEQTSTRKAMDQLQLFVNSYPRSERVDTINVLMDELQLKLERKAFEAGKLYLQTEHYTSAVVAFENSLQDYPDTPFREETYFLMFKARQELAVKSVEQKQPERIKEAKKAYRTFIDKYPNSEYLRTAETLFKELTQIEESLNNKV
jgi:outer membrane protein assembly factor BamD